jgi:beta-mannosidase
VELVQFDTAFLSKVAVLPSVKDGVPLLTIRPKVFGESAGHQIKVRVFDGLFEVLSYTFAADDKVNEQQVPTADLWQPRGRGDQKLYNVEVTLMNGSDELQQISKNVGFRTVELDTSAIASKDFPNKNMFAIKVNGLRLWIRGANWIPDDPFPTRVTKDRYEQRIKDMIEVNINGIRVWGGGIYESEDFYNFCDKEGIVVWQDFLFACAAYPETPEMFEEVELEVEEAILRLQTHPSLVIYCGGNECLEGFQYGGGKKDLPDALGVNLSIAKPYLAFYNNWINPDLIFPVHLSLRTAMMFRSFDSGTNHIWDVWNELGYERYEQYTPSFAAEFGFNGPGSWAMLTRAIGKSTLDSNDLDVANHQKAFDGMSKVAAGLAREFANPPTEGVLVFCGSP